MAQLLSEISQNVEIRDGRISIKGPVAKKFCAGVKIVAKQSATANANANVSVVDCSATILTTALNFFVTMGPFIEILHG